LTAFALYNHACYNSEILIKLLTFIFNVYKRFLFLSRFYVFNVFYFNMNIFFYIYDDNYTVHTYVRISAIYVLDGF